MIDITKAQASQSTVSGADGDWIISLDKENIYTLPARFTVQETFIVRDVVEKMMKLATECMKKQEQQLCLVKISRLTEHGDAKLAALRAENERLAIIIEHHLGES